MENDDYEVVIKEKRKDSWTIIIKQKTKDANKGSKTEKTVDNQYCGDDPYE